jgi:hypothetical protein
MEPDRGGSGGTVTFFMALTKMSAGPHARVQTELEVPAAIPRGVVI